MTASIPLLILLSRTRLHALWKNARSRCKIPVVCMGQKAPPSRLSGCLRQPFRIARISGQPHTAMPALCEKAVVHCRFAGCALLLYQISGGASILFLGAAEKFRRPTAKRRCGLRTIKRLTALRAQPEEIDGERLNPGICRRYNKRGTLPKTPATEKAGPRTGPAFAFRAYLHI